MKQSNSKLLHLDEIAKYKNILVFAKAMVEGYYCGRHRSPLFGSSAEVADFKEYVPGEDISRMDWRGYGRHRKFFIKQYREETEMIVYLMIDVSLSMFYTGRGNESKLHYATRIAAVLAYLMTKQGDKVALCFYSNKVKLYIPPGSTQLHMYSLLQKLEKVKTSGSTDLAASLEEARHFFKRRGRIVLISDFFTDEDAAFQKLSYFQQKRFDVMLMQLLDIDELYLPPVSIAKFVDIETKEHIQVEPADIASNYKKNVQEYIQKIEKLSNTRGFDFKMISKENPYFEAIESYLGISKKNFKK